MGVSHLSNEPDVDKRLIFNHKQSLLVSFAANFSEPIQVLAEYLLRFSTEVEPNVHDR